MATHGLFIGWNRPVTGRESVASELFASFVSYLTEQQSKGVIEDFEPVLLNLHGGDLNGFVLVRGHEDRLQEMRKQEHFNNLVTQCGINVEGFGVIDCWTGDGVMEQMNRWRGYIGG